MLWLAIIFCPYLNHFKSDFDGMKSKIAKLSSSWPVQCKLVWENKKQNANQISKLFICPLNLNVCTVAVILFFFIRLDINWSLKWVYKPTPPTHHHAPTKTFIHKCNITKCIIMDGHHPHKTITIQLQPFLPYVNLVCPLWVVTNLFGWCCPSLGLGWLT